MKELTSEEMACYDGGRLKCVLLGIAAGALTASIFTGGGLAGVAAAALAWEAFEAADC